MPWSGKKSATGQIRAPRRLRWRSRVPWKPAGSSRRGAPGPALRSAPARGRQRPPNGPKGGAGCDGGRPSLRSPPGLLPLRPRAHTCEGHTKAPDSRRTAAQTKARRSHCPFPPPVAWSEATGLPGASKQPGGPPRAPEGLAATHAGGRPPKPHARATTLGLTAPPTHTHTYTYTQVFLHTDPRTSLSFAFNHTYHTYTRVCARARRHRPQHQPPPPPTLPHSCVQTPLYSLKWIPGHKGTYTRMCPGRPPGPLSLSLSAHTHTHAHSRRR